MVCGWKFWRASSCLLIVISISSIAQANPYGDAMNEVGLTTAGIIKSRGFMARDHYVTSEDGYILNVVRATNPLINRGRSGSTNKTVVLFIHGVSTNANCFIVNSIGSKPQDYSHLDASSLDEAQLYELLRNDPSVNSLPFLLMNFGHEVWLLNRRGSPQSLGRSDGRNATVERVFNGEIKVAKIFIETLAKIVRAGTNKVEILSQISGAFSKLLQLAGPLAEADYWNYSFDEQAKYDFPAVIDYIRLATNRRKVSIVGHSAGGAITLMSLADNPSMTDKIGNAVLWSPAVNLGNDATERFKWPLTKVVASYKGPVPPLFSIPILATLMAGVCATTAAQNSLCRLTREAVTGADSEEQHLLPGQMIQIGSASAGKEFAHLGQNLAFDGTHHHFDHGDKSKNLAAYGSEKPPAYDFSRIVHPSLSLFAAASDSIVGAIDVEMTYNILSVPANFRKIGDKDGKFNHLGFLLNSNAGRLCNIPSLIELEF